MNCIKKNWFQFRFLQKGNIFNLLIFQIILIFGISNYSYAQTTLTSASATGSDDNKTATFETVGNAHVDVSAAAGDKVLVVATFQMDMTSPGNDAREASFQIVDELSNSSGLIKRSLGVAVKATDHGIGSVVYIFSVSNTKTKTYSLQHSLSSTARTLYTSATIAAVVLKAGTELLMNDVKRVGSTQTMTTTSAAVPGSITTAISPNGAGGFYVAASIESVAASTPASAEWKLQYNNGGGWTDLSPAVQRSMNSNGERGIINLVGSLPDWSPTGTYQFQIAHRQITGTSTTTEAANIVAVALGISTGKFPVFFEEDNTESGVTTSIGTLGNAITATMTPTDYNTSLFIHAQYSMTADASTNSTYDLFVDNSKLDGADQIRYIEVSGNKGSGASVGISSELTKSTAYNVSLRHSTTAGNLISSDLSLNGFGLTLESGPLPVELLNFNAQHSENSELVLNWATASETNNDYFIIERSQDALNWEIVEKVSGAGNSNTQLNYSLIDTKPFSGTSYYRLTQTDFNGEFKELKTISVLLNNNSNINLFPNPFADELIIEIDGISKNANIEIYNSNGQVVFKGIANERTIVPTTSFSQGIYLLKIDKGDSFEFRKIVKE